MKINAKQMPKLSISVKIKNSTPNSKNNTKLLYKIVYSQVVTAIPGLNS